MPRFVIHNQYHLQTRDFRTGIALSIPVVEARNWDQPQSRDVDLRYVGMPACSAQCTSVVL